MKKYSVVICGSGKWGTALSLVFDSPYVSYFTILCRSEESAKKICDTRMLSPEGFPEKINITHKTNVLKRADIIIIAIPVNTIRSFIEKNLYQINEKAVIVITSKGLEIKSQKILSHIICEYLPNATIAILLGPTFSKDVSIKNKCIFNLSCTDNKTQEILYTIIQKKWCLCHKINSIHLMQFLSALKNVMAIACGMAYKYGQSFNAAITSICIKDTIYIIENLGYSTDDFFEVSGIGDMILTCTSPESRNFQFGYSIAHNNSLDKALKENEASTIEGWQTLHAISIIPDNIFHQSVIIDALIALKEKKINVSQCIQMFTEKF